MQEDIGEHKSMPAKPWAVIQLRMRPLSKVELPPRVLAAAGTRQWEQGLLP